MAPEVILADRSKRAEECLEENFVAAWGMEVWRLRISLKDRRVVADAAPLLDEEEDEEEVEVAMGWPPAEPPPPEETPW